MGKGTRGARVTEPGVGQVLETGCTAVCALPTGLCGTPAAHRLVLGKGSPLLACFHRGTSVHPHAHLRAEVRGPPEEVKDTSGCRVSSVQLSSWPQHHDDECLQVWGRRDTAPLH